MEQLISKKEFSQWMRIEGEVRGIAFKSGMVPFIKEVGKGGIQRMEKVITELGYPINFDAIKPMAFYPLGLMAVSLLALQRLFDFEKQDFIEMGAIAAKSPLIVRLYLKYFGSLERVVDEVQKMHQKYFTIGNVEVVEINKEKRYVIIRRENFFLHPLHCYISQGFYPSVLQMVLKDKVSCEVTKCPYHKGDDYHEFVCRW